jgi:hypothetical protein
MKGHMVLYVYYNPSTPLPFSPQPHLSEFLSLLILAKENATGSREKFESPLSGSACISADGSWK